VAIIGGHFIEKKPGCPQIICFKIKVYATEECLEKDKIDSN